MAMSSAFYSIKRYLTSREGSETPMRCDAQIAQFPLGVIKKDLYN